MKKTKMEKGITLIALIISIVILLILAVVTIGAVNESKIIAHSQKASSEYTIAQEKETLQLAVGEWQLQKNTSGNEETFESTIKDALKKDIESGKITVEGEEDGSLTIKFTKTGHSYTVKSDGTIVETENNEKENNEKENDGKENDGTEVSTSTLVEMYKNGENCTEENCTNAEHLHQGDYVRYSPDGAEIYTLETSMSGVEGTQKIEKEDLAWRVLGCDGTKVLLISAEPTLYGPLMYGKIGFDNYESILNNICSTLYSNSSIGAQARSITRADIESYLGLSMLEQDDDSLIENLKEIYEVWNSTPVVGELIAGPRYDGFVKSNEGEYEYIYSDVFPFYYLVGNKITDNAIEDYGRTAYVFVGIPLSYGAGLYTFDSKEEKFQEANNGNCRAIRPVIELDKDTDVDDVTKLSKSEMPDWSWYDYYGLYSGS